MPRIIIFLFNFSAKMNNISIYREKSVYIWQKNMVAKYEDVEKCEAK